MIRRRQTLRRHLAVVVAAAGILAGCGAGGQPHARSQAAASCVAPTLTVTPSVARAGDTVRANGEYFAADCYDTGQAGTPPALTGLTIQVSQSGRAWTVASGVAASGDHYALHVPIQLPEQLRPGTVEVTVPGYSRPAQLRIRPRRRAAALPGQ